MKHLFYFSQLNENLPRQSTVNQLKRLRKLTKGVDIGDRISDMTNQGANILHITNPVDTGVESIEHFWKHNDPVKLSTTKSK
jgi:hypothetical protein